MMSRMSSSIIDVHSHTWNFPRDFGQDFLDQAKRAKAGGEVDLTVRFEDYAAAAPSDICDQAPSSLRR